jgi:hypothetical protein
VNVATGDVARFEEELSGGLCLVYVIDYTGRKVRLGWDKTFIREFYEEHKQPEEFAPTEEDGRKGTYKFHVSFYLSIGVRVAYGSDTMTSDSPEVCEEDIEYFIRTKEEYFGKGSREI